MNDTLNIDIANFITLENKNMLAYLMRKFHVTLEIAEDIMQDAYESCLRYRNSYKEYGSINQYVFGVVRKMVAEFFRSNKNPHSYTKEPEYGYAELTGNEIIQTQATEETVLSKTPEDLFKEVQHFIKMRLPKKQQEIARSYINRYMYTANPDIEYVAQETKTTKTNVNSVWSIVMRKIRRHLG